MTDLIAALEAATGPSFDLDLRIQAIVMADLRRDLRPTPRPYSASLDAALTLVPEGALWEVDHKFSLKQDRTIYRAGVGTGTVGRMFWIKECEAATPALALCIAALRALEG